MSDRYASGFITACRAGEVFDHPASAALFEEYERECANPLLGPCMPSREMYEALEVVGKAQCFAAYRGEVLVGFAFVLITELPHYGQVRRFAHVESLFVSPSERLGAIGGLLINAVKMHARESGCETYSLSAPVGSRLARLLFLSSDLYTNTHHVFVGSLA